MLYMLYRYTIHRKLVCDTTVNISPNGCLGNIYFKSHGRRWFGADLDQTALTRVQSGLDLQCLFVNTNDVKLHCLTRLLGFCALALTGCPS